MWLLSFYFLPFSAKLLKPAYRLNKGRDHYNSFVVTTTFRLRTVCLGFLRINVQTLLVPTFTTKLTLLDESVNLFVWIFVCIVSRRSFCLHSLKEKVTKWDYVKDERRRERDKVKVKVIYFLKSRKRSDGNWKDWTNEPRTSSVSWESYWPLSVIRHGLRASDRRPRLLHRRIFVCHVSDYLIPSTYLVS